MAAVSRREALALVFSAHAAAGGSDPRAAAIVNASLDAGVRAVAVEDLSAWLVERRPDLELDEGGQDAA